VFWHVQHDEAATNAASSGSSLKLLSSAWAFMAVTVALAVLASPVKRYTDAAAAQLADKAAYAQAVLGSQGGVNARTTRPYDGRQGTVLVPPAHSEKTP
jgi:multicomponent K+:H+ antiporter subunit D